MAVRKTVRSSNIVSKVAVGARLRALRKHKGLTLKTLSLASGVPLSTLSKIELGLASLNYDKFMLIAQALNVDMSVLLQTTDKLDAMHLLEGKVLKASSVEHDEYYTEHYQHKFLFSETSGKAMTPILATVFSREVTDFNEFIKHPGQEFAFVLSGAVKIVFENGNSISLKKNEAAYFDSTVGHVYLSSSKVPARVLAVCSDRH